MRTVFFSTAFVVSGLLLGSHTAAAQTTPARTNTPARDTSARTSASEKPPLVDTQGAYVAPGMTGAPKQRVLTDYDNNQVRPAVKEEAGQTSLSSQPADQVKARKIKTRRPPKRD